MKVTMKTIIKKTVNNFGHIIAAGSRVNVEVVPNSDLVKCRSSECGVFYTHFLNVK